MRMNIMGRRWNGKCMVPTRWWRNTDGIYERSQWGCKSFLSWWTMCDTSCYLYHYCYHCLRWLRWVVRSRCTHFCMFGKLVHFGKTGWSQPSRECSWLPPQVECNPIPSLSYSFCKDETCMLFAYSNRKYRKKEAAYNFYLFMEGLPIYPLFREKSVGAFSTGTANTLRWRSIFFQSLTI